MGSRGALLMSGCSQAVTLSAVERCSLRLGAVPWPLVALCGFQGAVLPSGGFLCGLCPAQ